jgi:hypothetical protein
MHALLEGFIKGNEAHGIDVALLEACLKEAEELYTATNEVVKEAEEKFGSSDFKAALINTLIKNANAWNDVVKNFSGMTGLAPQTAAGTLGTGGGALTGLMLSKMLGIENPGMAMLLASLLGGYAGHGSYDSPKAVAGKLALKPVSTPEGRDDKYLFTPYLNKLITARNTSS